MKKLLNLIKYLKPYWKESVIALILLTGVVILDLAIPRLLQQIIDEGITQGDMRAILNTSLLMLGLSILSTIFAIGNNTLSVRVAEGFARDLRRDLFLKIQNFSYGNLDRLKTGNLIVRLTSDITVLQQVFRMTLRIGTRAPLLMVGSFALMASTDWGLTLRILPLLLFTITAIVFFVTKLSPFFMQVQKKLDRLNTVMQENIAGVRVVKAFVRQDYEKERFEQANEGFNRIQVKILRYVSALFPSLSLLINVGVLIIIWFGGTQAIAGDLSVGQIVAFTNYLTTTMVPMLLLAMFSNVVASGIASAERVAEILEEEPEISTPIDAKQLPEKIDGRVEFEHVGFYYNGSYEEKILDAIELTVEPGQTVAVLGATGSGKSTLVNLIPRFYDVSEGRITIDGMDIREVNQDSLLSHVAITPQETILFSGTVRDNISYGKPDATDEEVEVAAKAAQAHDFIVDLPDGYQTEVAARGVNLSGGQKQRIAIARAILIKPDILILDDSTSSVDVETEAKIQDALDDLIQETTTFIVAQRISTVLNADKIVVLDKGRIVAQGRHEELLQTSEIYKEIYDSQLGNGNKALNNGKAKHVEAGV